MSSRLSLMTALIIVLVLGAGGLIVCKSARDSVAASQKREVETMAFVLTTAEAQAASLAAAQADTLAHDPEVARLLAAQDRTGLLAHTLDGFKRLKAEAGVNVMQFHTADIKSFLRVWDPENFGQDLSKARPMLLTVNHDRRPQKGLEMGLSGLSLRAAAPVLQGDSLVGTLEVGVDLKSLLDLAKTTTGADYGLFLDASLVKDGGGATLKRDAATNGDLFDALAADGRVGLSREATFGTARVGDDTLSLFGMPLVDYSGRMIGTIVVAANANDDADRVAQLAIIFATVALVGGLAAHALIMITARAMLIRPIDDLAGKVQALARGEQLGAPTSTAREYLAVYGAIRDASGGESDETNGQGGA
ncbi:cache domain-containing protein [Oryzibacter oryziterrae]|uniref:cache domain-containing protein n=1 Tax=Oryzibacter oryziterrae TaxID=2766474 RepID=UPI001F4051C5|nr:cache domain-containing protein [Oryzibacter oryziterrae]